MTNPNQQTQTEQSFFDVDTFEYGVYTSPQRDITAINIGVIGLGTITKPSSSELSSADAYTVTYN